MERIREETSDLAFEGIHQFLAILDGLSDSAYGRGVYHSTESEGDRQAGPAWFRVFNALKAAREVAENEAKMRNIS